MGFHSSIALLSSVALDGKGKMFRSLNCHCSASHNVDLRVTDLVASRAECMPRLLDESGGRGRAS